MDSSAMGIRKTKGNLMLIEGGGFSLQKGAGTLAGHAVGQTLSNKCLTN
jgi:hypothetical protein